MEFRLQSRQMKIFCLKYIFLTFLGLQVLLLEDKGTVSVGAPAVVGAKVTAKVENHVKGDKVIVFKKKRRKGYKKKNGHRQAFTELSITGIKVKKQPAAKAKEA